MHAERQLELGVAHADLAQQWQRVAAVLLCVAVPLLVFAPTVVDMAAIWWRSDTFTHGFLVFPAFVYLVWSQRAELAASPVLPAPRALFAVFGCGFLWASGVLAGALTPSFFGLIGLSVSSVITVLGWRVARSIWFPLTFLFFAVPFGEAFVPTLVEWTADFTVTAVAASGVPVYREGQNFVVPSGRWSVVDACSGIRYLLASMFVGSLYAWLMFRSNSRRLAFMAASAVVPILANWVRAYMIVMLGHLSDNKIAAGVDHLIYGWVFFGVVMFLLFAVGNLFREDSPNSAKLGLLPTGVPAEFRTTWRSQAAVGIAVLTIAIGWQAAAARMTEVVDQRPVVLGTVEAGPGWTTVSEASSWWRPRLQAPSATLTQRFEKDGKHVTLFIGIYRNQRQGLELINSMNKLARQIESPWVVLAETKPTVTFGQDQVSVNSALAGQGEQALMVWQWNWIWGRPTINEPWGKVTLAIDRFLARSDTSAWVAIYAGDDHNGKLAHAMLVAFASEMGPAIEKVLLEVTER